MRELTHPPHVIRIFPAPEEAARQLASDLVVLMLQLAEKNDLISLALSGGSTPLLLFRDLAELSPEMPMEKLHLFWVDERCVPHGDAASNYGQAEKEWLHKAGFPRQQIHRMRGENEPATEAARYARKMAEILPASNEGIPRLDIVLLGLGSDGHTASLFPGDTTALVSGKSCIYTLHPQTGKPRISLTPAVINNAGRVYFLVTGPEKSGPLSAIIEDKKEAGAFPGHYIRPLSGELFWYADRDAARELIRTD